MIKEIKPMDPLIRKLLPPQSPSPGTVYRPSQFVLKADGLIWNTLTQQCLEAELPETAHAGEGFDDLIRGCFLVPLERDECRFYQSLFALVRACQKKRASAATPSCRPWLATPDASTATSRACPRPA